MSRVLSRDEERIEQKPRLVFHFHEATPRPFVASAGRLTPPPSVHCAKIIPAAPSGKGGGEGPIHAWNKNGEGRGAQLRAAAGFLGA